MARKTTKSALEEVNQIFQTVHSDFEQFLVRDRKKSYETN